MADHYTYLVPLKKRFGIDEAVTPGSDDSYTIYIDNTLDEAHRMEAYNHAIRHIENCDFEKPDVQKIESSAHTA